MRAHKDLVENVDVHQRTLRAARRTGTGERQQDSLDWPVDKAEPEQDAFPYLEQMSVAARKHPYAALGAMIAVAGIIVAAIVTMAVAVFTGMFMMYGTMRETTANQVQIQQSLMAIQKQQTDDMNAVRAYASNNARRNEFIVGLLSRQSQAAIAEWDRANPRPELPGVNNSRKE